MEFIQERIREICKVLKNNMKEQVSQIREIEFAECKYKECYDNENIPDKNLVWNVFEENMRFGGKDRHFWFRFKIKTPPDMAEKSCFFHLITAKNGEGEALNPQGILYLDGEMIQGTDVNHTDVKLEFGKEYEAWIYMYSGMYDQLFDFEPSVYVMDERIKKLYYDLSVPNDALSYLDYNSTDYKDTLKLLNEAVNLLDLRKPGSEIYYDSIRAAEQYLDKEFYHGICGKSDAVVSCIGHTHIDVAWLWTVAQTREKAQRSFQTVIKLMEEYPEYRFMSSQPQLYAYVKESAPKLFQKIKTAVEDGRWEAEGAMWLEADCNLISGESMIRQILYGKRFFREEFQKDSKILWLPDVFGYSAAMPQILKKCGIDTFFTSKISWNETNTMPYDVFVWEGIDGSRVFTSFLTVRDAKPFGESDPDERYTSYSGYIRPSQVLGTWKRFGQKEYSKEALLTFGYGDGGGGPTRDMLEQQRRLSYGLPGFPKTNIDFAGNCLNQQKNDFTENSKKIKNLPRWVGELYLEMHRGTYTSMAKNKRNNRKSELAYQSAELMSVLNMLLTGCEYPYRQLENGWKKILLNQFHDIIPGSSIKEVYEDSDRSYREIFEISDKIQHEMLKRLAENIRTDGGILIFNPSGFKRSGEVLLNGKTVCVENIPPLGYKVVKHYEDTNSIKVTEQLIENKYFKICLEKGEIVSIYDKKHQREMILEGQHANELRVYEDIPKNFDAWEITDYYKQKMWLADDITAIEKMDDGVRAGLKITRKFQDSTIEQIIWVYEFSGRIDFDTKIDWHENHLLVKAAFPFRVHTSEATYDIQFGSVKRPTHKNTGWDAAKFEVCAHKWADVSDSGYGISLLNDCKYGYSTEDSTMELSLLKCATYPNPHADQGLHQFVYSLFPHSGEVYSGKTIREAYELNQPLTAIQLNKTGGALPEEFSMTYADCEELVIETVKKAENSDDIIVRMYESKNRAVSATVRFGFAFKKAFLCDMLENELMELNAAEQEVKIEVGNFEIITLKLKR